jgi:hypothetical protein
MSEPIEDTAAQGRIADLFAPAQFVILKHPRTQMMTA